MQKRVRDIPVMYDLDVRFRIMEQYQDYAQVLTLNLPPIEVVAGPKESPDLAKLANDSMRTRGYISPTSRPMRAIRC